MFEVYRNGVATHYVFLTENNATLWIKTHCLDDAAYSVRPCDSEMEVYTKTHTRMADSTIVYTTA